MSEKQFKRSEMIKVLAVIATAYPNMKDITDSQVDIWYNLLNDIELKAIQLAVQTHIVKEVFPPSVAQIRKAAIEATVDPITEKTEAWGLVQEAIRKYGYSREIEALSSLPPEVAKTAKSMGWRDICHSEKPDVVRGQFLRMYDSISQREESERMIPPALDHQAKELRAATKMLANKYADNKKIE